MNEEQNKNIAFHRIEESEIKKLPKEVKGLFDQMMEEIQAERDSRRVYSLTKISDTTYITPSFPISGILADLVNESLANGMALIEIFKLSLCKFYGVSTDLLKQVDDLSPDQRKKRRIEEIKLEYLAREIRLAKILKPVYRKPRKGITRINHKALDSEIPQFSFLEKLTKILDDDSRKE